MNFLDKVPIHVEVNQLEDSVEEPEAIKEKVEALLNEAYPVFTEGPIDFSSSQYLQSNVASIHICDLDECPLVGDGPVSFWRATIFLHVYQLCEEGPEQEMVDGEEDLPALEQWALPARELHGLWGSLVLEHGVKRDLVEYAQAALLFSDKGVDPALVTWNRVVLLHGPPGTGKTSLCKALAQKLAIRLSDRYNDTHLLEINAHSLFSKWFSESGKLVMRLFQHIQELVEDEESLVCVLIDEVESLTAARSSALGGSEPGDAVRVVNAVLTQLDNLRKRPNVLVLATSNLSSAIDIAFVDRADIKQYVGLPPARARHAILRGCLAELMRAGLAHPPRPLATWEEAARASRGRAAGAEPQGDDNKFGNLGAEGNDLGAGLGPASAPIVQEKIAAPPEVLREGMPGNKLSSGMMVDAGEVSIEQSSTTSEALPKFNTTDIDQLLLQTAELAEGLSGRALRKLPFQAHAFFIQKDTALPEEYAAAFLSAVKKEQRARENMQERVSTSV